MPSEISSFRPRPDLAILPAAPAALPEISALARRIWPVAYKDVLTDAQIAAMLDEIYTLDNLTHEMHIGHRFWLAYDVKTPVGFASAYREGDIMWLRKLYVLPDYQGRGLGKALLDAAASGFPDVREQRLCVMRHNLPAQRFYARLGFAPAGEIDVNMGGYAMVDFVYARPCA